METLDALAQAMPAPDDILTYWGGDINTQWNRPREGDTDEAAAWLSFLARHAAHPAPMDGPTRIDREGESQIDTIAGPAATITLYGVRKAWKTSLSDHALLYADPTTQISTRRDNVLTPWAFKTLPALALDDLRRTYAYLERVFRVPDVDLTGLPQETDWVAPAAPGHLPEHHVGTRVRDDSGRVML